MKTSILILVTFASSISLAVEPVKPSVPQHPVGKKPVVTTAAKPKVESKVYTEILRKLEARSVTKEIWNVCGDNDNSKYSTSVFLPSKANKKTAQRTVKKVDKPEATSCMPLLETHSFNKQLNADMYIGPSRLTPAEREAALNSVATK
jgi:hypothetical protein